MTQRAIDGPFVYFVTTNTTFRVRFFDTQNRVKRLTEIIHNTCHECGFNLLGYAVMPDHIHLLVCKNGSVTLSSLMKLIKGRFWRTQGNGRFWQPRFNFRIIEDENRMANTIEYMRNNFRHHGLGEEFGQLPYVMINEGLVAKTT